MELVDVTLTDFTRRSRSVVIAHSDTALTRGLDYGESLLVRVDGGEYRTAVVVDIMFQADDTEYRLVLGGRVPGDLVAERLETPVRRERTRERVSVNDIVDMLGRAGAAQRIPMPRQSAEQLLR